MGSAFIRRDTDFDYYCSYLLLMMNIFMINISLNNALLKRDIKNTEMPFHLKHFFCMFHTAWNIQQMNKSCSAMLHTIFPYLYHFLIYRFYDIHPQIHTATSFFSWLILYYIPNHCSWLNFLYSTHMNRMTFKGTNASLFHPFFVDHWKYIKHHYRSPWFCTLSLLTFVKDRILGCMDSCFEPIVIIFSKIMLMIKMKDQEKIKKIFLWYSARL